VLKILIILPIAKDRSKHLWITASINIFLADAGLPGRRPASAEGAKKSYTVCIKLFILAEIISRTHEKVLFDRVL
jgi:hypothetical protein